MRSKSLPSLVFVTTLAVACGSATGSDDDVNARTDSGANADGAPGDGSGDANDLPDAPACATASAKLIKAPVDVIIAIDGSPSMGEEQTAVVENINTRLAAILDAAGLDYHVVMVSGGYCFKGPLASDAPCTEPNRTKLPRFFHAVQSVNNSDALTLLLWTYDGYTRPPNTCDKKPMPALKWKDQLRADAMKYFIVVTDDDPSTFDYTYAAARSASEGTTCPPKPGKIDPAYCAYWNCPTFADKTADWGGEGFEKELYKLAPAGMFGNETNRKWVFHAIVGVPSELTPDAALAPFKPACSEDGNTGENTGTEYQVLAKRTGGVRFPVCRTATGGGYAPVFSKISSTIVGVTACEYKLSSTGLGTIDLAKVNVSLDPGDGSGARTVPNDATKPCASGANGWQYKDGGSTIVLCGAACEASKSSKAKVSVYVGCATEVVK